MLPEQVLGVHRHEPLRAAHEVVKGVERQLHALVVEVLEVELDVGLEEVEEVDVRADPRGGLGNQRVAVELIALEEGAVLVREDLVPDADAVHGDEGAAAAVAVLDVVTTDEQRQRQALALDDRHGDAAVPPARIAIVRVGLDALDLHDLLDRVDLGLALERGKRAPLLHVARVLVEHVLLLEGEHGARYKRLPVLVVHQAEHVVGALDGLGQDLDVVVHEQDVGGARLLVHGLDHAAREASGTTHVVVGMDAHATARERRGIEGAAVVHDVEGEVPRHRLVAAQDPILDDADVAEDVVLLLEGGGRDGQLHLVQGFLVDLGVVPGLGDGGGALGHHHERQERGVEGVELVLDVRELVCVDVNDVEDGPARVAARLVDAAQLEVHGAACAHMQPDVVHDGVAAPLHARESVEVRREVDARHPGAGDGRLAVVRGDGGRAPHVEVGIVVRARLVGEDDVCQAKVDHRAARSLQRGHPAGCPMLPGGDEGARTLGLRLAKPALSQLSYIPMWAPPGATTPV